MVSMISSKKEEKEWSKEISILSGYRSCQTGGSINSDAKVGLIEKMRLQQNLKEVRELNK